MKVGATTTGNSLVTVTGYDTVLVTTTSLGVIVVEIAPPFTGSVNVQTAHGCGGLRWASGPGEG